MYNQHLYNTHTYNFPRTLSELAHAVYLYSRSLISKLFSRSSDAKLSNRDIDTHLKVK